MKVHEYQAKDLLKAAGVAVPEGIVVTTPEEAAEAFGKLGGGLIVVKAQVHAGGRGKGIAIGPNDDHAEALEIASGRKPRKDGMARGVQLVRSRDDAKAAAASLLGKTLVTYQTGIEGQVIVKELYLGMAVDRAYQCPVLMATTEGGVEIEQVAHDTPEKIHKEPIDVGVGLADFQARKVCKALGLSGETAKKGEVFFKKFVKFFLESDASLAEINPLIVTDKGEVLALDAKLNFDDNALYRHKEIAEMRDFDEEDPLEVRANESGIGTYIKLTGNIGCVVNGAGLAMATMDAITLAGGEPANFLDIGTVNDPERVIASFRILMDDPDVKAVLINIFGGMARVDIIAQGVIDAHKEMDIRVPIVARLVGTNVEEGERLLAESGVKLIRAQDLGEAAKKAVEAAAGKAAQ
jgi:succinyl-CoA synthetase beta subunit